MKSGFIETDNSLTEEELMANSEPVIPMNDWKRSQAQSYLGMRYLPSLATAEELWNKVDIISRIPKPEPSDVPAPTRLRRASSALRALFGGGILLISGCAQVPGDRVNGQNLWKSFDESTVVVCYTTVGPSNIRISCVQVREGKSNE